MRRGLRRSIAVSSGRAELTARHEANRGTPRHLTKLLAALEGIKAEWAKRPPPHPAYRYLEDLFADAPLRAQLLAAADRSDHETGVPRPRAS